MRTSLAPSFLFFGSVECAAQVACDPAIWKYAVKTKMLYAVILSRLLKSALYAAILFRLLQH